VDLNLDPMLILRRIHFYPHPGRFVSSFKQNSVYDYFVSGAIRREKLTKNYRELLGSLSYFRCTCARHTAFHTYFIF
jgi:hypothetical protein